MSAVHPRQSLAHCGEAQPARGRVQGDGDGSLQLSLQHQDGVFPSGGRDVKLGALDAAPVEVSGDPVHSQSSHHVPFELKHVTEGC